jgi:hypothetical protein
VGSNLYLPIVSQLKPLSTSLAAYLLDLKINSTPTQFSLLRETVPVAKNLEITSMLPNQFQGRSYPAATIAGRTATMHAYIYAKHPKYFVIASDQLYKKLERYVPNESAGYGNNYIRKYLTPKDPKNKTLNFRSEYVFPDRKIPLQKVHENESFIILEDASV